MIIIQIIGFLILLAVLVILVDSIKRRGFDAFIVFLALVICILSVIVIFPGYVADFLGAMGFYRPLDAFLTFVSITALIVCTKVYLKQKELDKNITELVRHVALEEVDVDKE